MGEVTALATLFDNLLCEELAAGPCERRAEWVVGHPNIGIYVACGEHAEAWSVGVPIRELTALVASHLNERLNIQAVR